MNPQNTAVSLENLLSKLLTSEDLHDVTLKGSDGVKVTAIGSILAGRSPVFKSMLFGKFSEAKKDVVEIKEYPGSVLQAVVEFIHTDQPQMLNWKKRKEQEDNPQIEMGQIQTLVSLAAAAKYFDLPVLTEKLMEFFSKKQEETPSVGFTLLEVCRQDGPTVPKDLISFALSCIRKSGIRVGNPKDVAYLSQETLEEILKDQLTEMTEHQLFMLLQSWVQSDPTNRQLTAKQLVPLIRLHKISAEHLSSCVEPSGLASSEQVLNAYKSHALANQDGGRFIELGRRTPLVWSDTLSIVFKSTSSSEQAIATGSLLCSPMTSGVYEWTLEMLPPKGRRSSFLGIIPHGVEAYKTQWAGYQQNVWGFSTNGNVFAGTGLFLSRGNLQQSLRPGGRVTLRLSLVQGQEGNGTLTVFFQNQGEESVVLDPLSNLLDELPKYPGGFVPIVSVCGNGGLRLIDLKKLE